MMPRMTAEPDPGAFRPPRFEVQADEREGTLVLRLGGELDLVSEPILEAALARARGPPGPDRPRRSWRSWTRPACERC